jgi:transposase-like protein
MVRKYIKKRSKPEFPEEDIQKAVKAVMSPEMKLLEVAAVFGLNPSTLYYRVQKAKNNQEVGNLEPKPQFSSKYIFCQISSSEDEDVLCNFLSHAQNSITASLTNKKVRTGNFKKLG